MFFSDATLLANKGSLSAHPVMLSIGNLPASLAQKSQIMLGLLAEFDKGVKINGDSNQKNLTEEEHGQIRRALMAKQTAAMVAPLVHASYEGIRFTSPLDGEQMRMFPTLFCAPLDHPEICSHLGIKNGYCGVCKWMPENNDKDRAEYRKEGDSVLFVDTISKAPARNIHALKKKQGAHGQRSGLWGFNGSSPVDRIPRSLSQATKVGVQKVGCSTPWTDLHLSVAGETMHEIDLGILVYAKNAVVQHLRDGLDKSDQEIEAINEALRLAMAEESRWPGLPYPPTKKVTAVLQGYLGGSSRIEAGEHRAVLQFIVPILVRFLGMDDPSTRLMAHIVEYYRARQVRDQEIQPVDRVHTLESLDRVDELFSEVKRSLQEIGFSNTSKETPKMHQQTHFRLQVMRLGLSSITTGQAGEANNARLKAPVKAGRTNKQKGVVLRTIVKLYRRSRASAAASRDKLRGRVVCRTSTLARRYKRHGYLAVQRDQCVYPNQRYVPKQNRFTTLDIYNWTRFRLGSAAHPRQMAKRDATIDLRRDLFDSVPIDSLKDKDSPLNRQLETVFGDWTVGRAFANELSFFLTGEKDSFAYGVNLVLKTVPAASNPSVVSRPSREETEVRVLHKIHADPNYRGSNTTWYDFIAIKGEVPDKGDQVWYARLVLLFHIRDPRKKGKWRQLAFVRYLTRQELLQDELQRLRRPGEPQTTSLTFSKRQRNGKVVWYYGVCSSEAILRRIHVVAGNSEGSVSLRYSKGDRRYFEVDRKAKFLLNYNIFEYPTPAYYRPRPPDDEASTSEPQSSTSSPSSL